jgi:hypothetical protein
MGQVVRLCIELGLHRREVIDMINDKEDRRIAINTFWSAFVLDRRWAFSAGLPYVVADGEIDPDLPYPVSQATVPRCVNNRDLCFWFLSSSIIRAYKFL